MVPSFALHLPHAFGVTRFLAAQLATVGAIPRLRDAAAAHGKERIDGVRAWSRTKPVQGIVAMVAAAGLAAAARATARVCVQRWITYLSDVANALDDDGGIVLTPIAGDVHRIIANHPDAARPDVASALRYHELGLRNGFVWLDGDEPLCMQWLFTPADNAALSRLPAWSGMYPELTAGTGQVEKLWAFSTARGRGIATRFAQAMAIEAARRGIRRLRTHIHDTNEAAHRWALRTGWVPTGEILRYRFNLPLLRGDEASVCVHQSMARIADNFRGNRGKEP